MNKKKLMGVILLLSIAVVYCGLYVAVTNILMPLDLDFAKSGLNTSTEPLIDESVIKETENSAVLMENSPYAKDTPHSQRVIDANNMRKDKTSSEISPEVVQGIADFKKLNYYSVWAYYLIFRWDIANEISSISNIMDKLEKVENNSDIINEKLATDWEKGNTKAVAADLRDSANNLRQINSLNSELNDHYQNLAKQIEKK